MGHGSLISVDVQVAGVQLGNSLGQLPSDGFGAPHDDDFDLLLLFIGQPLGNVPKPPCGPLLLNS